MPVQAQLRQLRKTAKLAAPCQQSAKAVVISSLASAETAMQLCSNHPKPPSLKADTMPQDTSTTGTPVPGLPTYRCSAATNAAVLSDPAGAAMVSRNCCAAACGVPRLLRLKPSNIGATMMLMFSSPLHTRHRQFVTGTRLRTAQTLAHNGT
jgi:cytochrome P450